MPLPSLSLDPWRQPWGNLGRSCQAEEIMWGKVQGRNKFVGRGYSNQNDQKGEEQEMSIELNLIRPLGKEGSLNLILIAVGEPLQENDVLLIYALKILGNWWKGCNSEKTQRLLMRLITTIR